MPDKTAPSEFSAKPKASTAPGFVDAAWPAFWRERSWIAPDRSKWVDPFQDRRFLLYAASLRDKFGYVRFVGLPTQGGPEDTPIESLFVEPALSGARIDPNVLQEEWPESTAMIDAVIDHPRLVVLGDPGSGKSTLVSWLVLSLLSRDKNRLKDAVGPLLPVTLVLRDLDIVGEITWEKLLGRFVSHTMGQTLGSVDVIEDYLKRGQAMVLVDGLDEAGGTATRRAIVDALQLAFHQYTSVRWLITSRVVGYEDAPPDEEKQVEIVYRTTGRQGGEAERPWADETVEQRILAERLYVSPFDDARIAMFVRNWHEQHEPDRAERSTRSAELIEALHRSPQVKGLARTPNLLTMIVLVYRVYLRLPDGRALLYERIAQAYLETIETARKLPMPGHTLEDMKRWLGYAAFQMQRARFGAEAEHRNDHGILIARSELVEYIVFAMSKGNAALFIQHRPTAIAFVDWVARRAGLVIPRSEDLFAFAHLSFQEYFAAWFLAEQITGPAWNKPHRTGSPLSAGTDLPTLQIATSDVRWHETLVLLFELLALRGEWADEVLHLLFAPTDNSAWPTRLGIDQKLSAALKLATDLHSGLSQSSRVACYRQAWRKVSAGSREMFGERRFTISTWFADDFFGATRSQWETVFACFDEQSDEPLLQAIVWSKADDEFIARLCGAGPGASQCTSAWFGGLEVTDATFARLSANDSRLKLLTSLGLYHTNATDEGVKEIARSNTRLKTLTWLSLVGTPITDAGVKELARTNTGLPALTRLNLGRTQVTDAGVAELARTSTGIRGLSELYLGSTHVTDAGVKELTRTDTGLKGLSDLSLSYTKVTDAGVIDLARADTGLNALTTLFLAHTQVSDVGLFELARADSGLKDLTSLNLEHTNVTDAGILAVKKRWPGITIER